MTIREINTAAVPGCDVTGSRAAKRATAGRLTGTVSPGGQMMGHGQFLLQATTDSAGFARKVSDIDPLLVRFNEKAEVKCGPGTATPCGADKATSPPKTN